MKFLNNSFVIILFAVVLYTKNIYTLAILDPYRTNLIIFSKDRPLQLHTLLKSIETYMTGLNAIYVLYNTSDSSFDDGYSTVQAEFSSVIFYKEFLDTTLNVNITLALADVTTDYYIFSVDDMVVKDYVDVKACAQAITTQNAYAFYLALGNHLHYCYPYDVSQPLPSFTSVNSTISKWNFFDGVYDWDYPNSISMVLYRKTDVILILTNNLYTSPSELCGIWQEQVPSRSSGLCYNNSKVLNIPLNKVNFLYDNRQMNLYSANDLLTIYNEGKIIDISPLHQISNNSTHIEYTPTFINY